MKEEKKQLSFRLSESIIRELDGIAKRQGVSRTDVVNILVHAYSTGVTDEDIIEEWFNMRRIS